MTEDVEVRVQGAPDVQCVGDHGELSDEQKFGVGIRDREVDGTGETRDQIFWRVFGFSMDAFA